jgi:hypothetical protein
VNLIQKPFCFLGELLLLFFKKTLCSSLSPIVFPLLSKILHKKIWLVTCMPAEKTKKRGLEKKKRERKRKEKRSKLNIPPLRKEGISLFFNWRHFIKKHN